MKMLSRGIKIPKQPLSRIKKEEAKSKISIEIIREQIKDANISISNAASATFPINHDQLANKLCETLHSLYSDSLQIGMRFTTNVEG